jgi:hypothetical protein
LIRADDARRKTGVHFIAFTTDLCAAISAQCERMAGVLSRGSAHADRLSLPIRLGPLRSWESGKMPAARRFVDLRARSGVRAPRRRRRCRIPLRVHDGRRRRYAQYLLRSRRLRDCLRSGQCKIITRVAGREWKLRTPTARAGFMKSLLWIFQFAFGCRHRHVSRVFTIKHRTCKVCFDCVREFDLPDAHVHVRSVNARTAA